MARKSDSIPQKLRLKDNHPTSIKVQKLYDFCEELGISIRFDDGVVIIRDRDRDVNLPSVLLQDLEFGRVYSFPPTFEYKLIYNNPEYLAQREIENQEDLARYIESERLKKEKELAEKKAEEARRAAELEAKERKLLEELKVKYER